MKKFIAAFAIMIMSFSASASTGVNFTKNLNKSVSEKVTVKKILYVVEVTLSCGITMSVNSPNNWTTQQIVNWVLAADALLCEGGGPQ